MIYLVADRPDERTTLTRTLTSMGYKAESFDCGTEVIKRLQFRTCELIILDCGMEDSFDLLAKVRAAPFGRPVPVVMFGTAPKEQQQKAVLQGADAFVVKKSLDWEDLSREIQRYAGPPRLHGGEDDASRSMRH